MTVNLLKEKECFEERGHHGFNRHHQTVRVRHPWLHRPLDLHCLLSRLLRLPQHERRRIQQIHDRRLHHPRQWSRQDQDEGVDTHSWP